MKISEDILMKHLTKATIEQVSNDYQKNGYEVIKDACLDNIRADLVARKDGELIVLIFKSKKIWGKDRIQEIKQLRNYVVRMRGTGFKLVLVNNPLEGVSVKIDNLDQILLDLVIKNPALYDDYTFAEMISEYMDCQNHHSAIMLRS